MVAVTCDGPLPVAEARAGEPEAWDVLFQRYQLPLYTYVFELVHNEQSALDIVQETFIAAARHLDRLREDAKFGSWLFGIAHQKCIQEWRKRRPVESLDESDAEGLVIDHVDPRAWLIKKEEEEEFMDLINRLPWPQRSVLLLHFLEEFSLESIAEITDLPLGTIKSRLHYAKRALRKFIAERAREGLDPNQTHHRL